MANDDVLLQLSGVTRTFGGLTAVDGVDLTVRRGQIYSIIGPNGAGKTTVFNLITGIYRPTSGDVTLDGNSIVGYTPDRVLRAGVARTFQNIRLFNNMTVLENVLVGQHVRFPGDLISIVFHLPNYNRAERAARARAIELLGFFGPSMVALQDEYALNLSYADRRRVEVARALGSNPKLLMLDEPTAGMNDAETAEAVGYIQALRRDFGVTILLIEHKLQVTMGLSDRIAVLDYGKKIAEGLPDEIRTNELVIEAYLGRKAAI
ncbi:MAG TPA: ABC transporter ATP-binding protein [Ktedonobacterales bacterium]|jgi:branched-chain amino acid transport system ATP-binding protein